MAGNGQIIVGPGLPVVSCKVVDFSAGGACLEIAPKREDLPDRFDLLYGGIKKRSRIVWRHGIRVGVTF
jgi:hypothetical protein